MAEFKWAHYRPIAGPTLQPLYVVSLDEATKLAALPWLHVLSVRPDKTGYARPDKSLGAPPRLETSKHRDTSEHLTKRLA